MAFYHVLECDTVYRRKNKENPIHSITLNNVIRFRKWMQGRVQYQDNETLAPPQ